MDARIQQSLGDLDLLGALTGDVGLPGDAIGKIDIVARRSYVAVRRDRAEAALRGLRAGKIKGRTFRVSRLGGAG